MDIIVNIAEYINFLKERCHLYVSLHPILLEQPLLSSGRLMRYNFHENFYCALIKQNTAANKRCLQCQKQVVSACTGGVFNGTCFAGVRERVYPISNGETITGFISVSGYQTQSPHTYFIRLADKYGFSSSELQSAYETLKAEMPSDEELDTLLLPLCYMIELAYRKSDIPESALSLFQQIVAFIKQNRNQNITSKDICQHFSCSRSYMSTLFNRKMGKSIREYINELRIRDAKVLLKTTNLTVTDIAFTVGFNSSNYFAELFRKKEGLSPLQYKKASRQ